LMPLIQYEDVRLKNEGAQPLLVFSDEGRSMGLLVDEIVDIVEDKLDIELTSERPGMLGSAVVKSQATEIMDVGHFLSLAFEGWFRRKDLRSPSAARTLLLVDDSAFFRNMLAPLLKAAGYQVSSVGSAHEALQLLRSGQRFDVILTDIDMPGMNGFDFAVNVRGDPRIAGIPIIALTSIVSPEAIERGRQVGFHDYVAKFDRAGLISALKEQSASLNEAA
jgi:two-component system chemotaxis sensor kinase CheA